MCILFKAALEDAAAANGLPLEEKSLSEILGTDEDGSPKMYTTLYDDQNRIISTNDPTLAQDSFYLGGGTLDLGAAVYVRFRMVEILPQHEVGIQENVTYCMDNLPQELVPTETDREGNEILNPEEPVEFFQLGGNVTGAAAFTAARKSAASVRRCPDGSGGTEEEVEQITDHSPTF